MGFSSHNNLARDLLLFFLCDCTNARLSDVRFEDRSVGQLQVTQRLLGKRRKVLGDDRISREKLRGSEKRHFSWSEHRKKPDLRISKVDKLVQQLVDEHEVGANRLLEGTTVAKLKD